MAEQNRFIKVKGWIAPVMVSIAILFPVTRAEATHLRAGEITVKRVNCTSREFAITVTVYTDTESTVLFGGSQDVLDFGDGTWQLVEETKNTPYPGYPSIGVASRTYTHTFPGQGKYTISYIEPNRNQGVLNMSNSVGTTFYLETQIDLSALGCGNSPKLLIPPIDKACTGVAFFHNPGAYDIDGDSLSYELVVPFRDRNTEVIAYRSPDDASFYPDYQHGNENGSGPPTFEINPKDGTILWDAPSLPHGSTYGEYNIAFVIKEWRSINGVMTQIGFVRRDMQIIVEECENERPRLEIPEDLCVVAGTTIDETIFGYDDTFYLHKDGVFKKDDHPVKIEAFSEILASTFLSHAIVSPYPAAFKPSDPPVELQFTWNTICEHIKEQPYQIVFKITDHPPIGPDLATFETWKVTVVGPQPVLDTILVDKTLRYTTLKWSEYDCSKEASIMQIWRKVGETSYTLDTCDTGMPESLGFTLIAQRPMRNSQGLSDTTFVDTNNGKGLDPGAQYCYRLVAVFPPPKGGLSLVSEEICIEPLFTTDPVITNVSVEQTSDTDGKIRIAWVPPLDSINAPGPYDYKVQRVNGEDFIDVSGPTPIDTTFYPDAFLNTKDVQYFYRAIAFPENDPPPPDTIGISSIASSVVLDLQSQQGQITLSWSAVVPWSNQIQAYPLHEIYRWVAGSTDDSVNISVDVLQHGLTYVDRGLDINTEYCYRVMTRGGYGNPLIPEPLENYSQSICAFPRVEEPPCIPVLEPFVSVCDENYFQNYGCNPVNFINELKWSLPQGEDCTEDVRYYNIYVSGSTDGSYSLLATNVRDTFYLDKGLASLARCYRIAAVDRSGIESELSEPMCNDNCPYYELPNVFTPGDGRCNELFSAFGVDKPSNEASDCREYGHEEKCARFVLQVDFTVYNRWGKKLYNYVGQLGNDNNSIYINWDGHDENGSPLPSGIYYYSAEVTYDLVDPSKRVKMMKGWIHLNRFSN